MPKILIADDEPSIRDFLKYCLISQGFEIIEAENGNQALAKALDSLPDLIMLDVMMPEKDGLEACRAIRNQPSLQNIPILMLTAKSEELDIVIALDTGADDYLTKPFKTMELLARIRALLRRAAPTELKNELIIGALRIDFNKYEAFLGLTKLQLTHTEFELLKLLATNPGRTFSRDELLDKVWGVDYYGETRTVDSHIKNLRQKLAADDTLAETIVTIRSVGYRMNL